MKAFDNKQCQECTQTFLPTGPAQKFCPPCGKQRAKRIARAHTDRYRAAHGVRVGIGSGTGQPKGKDHPMYVNGITGFIKFSRTARETIRYCQHPNCGKDLLNAKQGEWAVHHIDHDRTNNERSNWQLLCKYHHQVIHRCWENFQRRDTKPPTSSQPPVDSPLPVAA